MIEAVKEWTDVYHPELDRLLQGCTSLLDVGCGSSSPVQKLKNRPPRIVGVDGFGPSIEVSREKGIHDDYVQTDLRNVDKFFPKDSFDCVTLLDVIEHFPKEEGFALLEKLETIAKRRVIVFTPNGFLPQGAHSGNELQRHLSGWTVEEMRALGYEVIGMNGWKKLRGEFGLIRLRPSWFWLIISRLTQPLVRNRPEHAFALLCVKDLEVSNPKAPHITE
ncbi:class I SAM-dependent methyltransferase [Candidatus Parcubacteria bacterium]|nr:MAG: class I SAM-dependent methyltransferase [Candidatus Parcubacteria bacterium]